MKLASFNLSPMRPTKIILPRLSTFWGLFYFLFVAYFILIIQPVKFNSIIAATSALWYIHWRKPAMQLGYNCEKLKTHFF